MGKTIIKSESFDKRKEFHFFRDENRGYTEILLAGKGEIGKHYIGLSKAQKTKIIAFDGTVLGEAASPFKAARILKEYYLEKL